MVIEPPRPGPKKFPFVTVGLIMVNVIVYLITTASTNFLVLPENEMTNQLIFFPSDFFNGQNWYTLITSQFLHGDPTHIISNMYFLFVFGDDLEFAFGKPAFIIFYLFSGIIAGIFFSVIQLLYASVVSPTNLGAILSIGAVGASGALFGVMAGYGFSFPNRPLRICARKRKVIKAKVFVIFYVAIEVISTIIMFVNGADTVAHAAHIGGFLGGMMFTFIFQFFNKDRYTKIKNLLI